MLEIQYIKQGDFVMRCFMIMVVAAVLTGCATAHVQVQRPEEKKILADGREVVAELKGDNTCYYLFGFIPLWCGNSNRPNTGDYYIFRSRLSEIRNDAMLKDFAARLGADSVINIQHQRRSAGAYCLWIVCTEAITSTGTAVSNP